MRNKSTGKSERMPLRDVSNCQVGCSESTWKIKAGSEKDDPNGFGDAVNLIHLVHSDMSNIFQQIDELVLQVVRAEEVHKQGIESFYCVLAEMVSSLKPWIPNLQKAISSKNMQIKTELRDNLAFQSPEPSKTECFVSPSPLVSCATGCTDEMDKQLFALTPLPRLKTASPEGQSVSKPVALQRHNSIAAVFPCCFSNVANSAQNVENSPAHVAKKLKTTPCLKWSPGRSCNITTLLEPTSGFCSRNFDREYKLTPFPLGKQRLRKLLEEESSDREASPNRKKAFDASPTWSMSPPKTCVLKDPSDDNPMKEDEFGTLSGAFEQHINLESCGKRSPLVESTPMWKEPHSILYKGRYPGENTLKKELWVRFEAATTNGDGLNLNLTFFKKQEDKGFLYMLDEAS